MECVCGCGGITQNGRFLPGHDQKLRASLERKMGSIEGLRDLVDLAVRFNAGEIDSDALAKHVKALLSKHL